MSIQHSKASPIMVTTIVTSKNMKLKLKNENGTHLCKSRHLNHATSSALNMQQRSSILALFVQIQYCYQIEHYKQFFQFKNQKFML